jgi:transcriptional/translational regulatory protein YebC/TACO1
MPISMLESSIFKDMFGTAAMRDVFDDAATVRRYTETEIALEGDQAESMQKLLDALENLDDVQEVFTNAEL